MQAATGIGFALVCAPVLVTLLGPREAVRSVLVLSMVLNVAVLARERRGLDVRRATMLFVPAALATPAAAWVVRRTDTRVLSAIAGVLTVAAVAALARGVRSRRGTSSLAAAGAGVVSAGMNVAGGIGGPAAVVYATNAGWPAATTRPTLQAYFLALNVVALLSLGLPHPRPVLAAALVAGWAAGTVSLRRLPDATVLRVTLLLAAAGGVAAIVKAF